MREFRQIIVTRVRTVFFKLFKGLPGPGIAISHRSIAKPEGVVNAYEGDRAAGDRAQEPCGAWVQAEAEYLERVTGL